MATHSPLAAVQQYIDGFNNGDIELMAATFAEGEHHGASGYFVTIGDAGHDNVTGDSAYVVVPAGMTFTLGDKRVTQTGASFTVALRKQTGGWRIAAWAWTKGKQ